MLSWKALVSGVLVAVPLLAAAALELRPLYDGAVIKLYEDEAFQREGPPLQPGTRLLAHEKTRTGFRVMVGGKEYWVSQRQAAVVPTLDADCSTRDRRGMQLAGGRAANDKCRE